MKINYDKEADALTIIFSKDKIIKDELISENVFAGLSRENKLVEIQILDISENDRPWLTIKAASKLLGKSERTILRWIHSKKLNAKKVGKEYQIKPEDLESIAS